MEQIRARVSAVPVAAWLIVFVAVSAVVRFLVSLDDPAPFIFQDELLYSELGKSLGTTGHFALRDVPGSAGVGPVYPGLISPAYALFDSLLTAYAAVKAINAVLMSLVAIPVYFVARRLLAPLPSLVAAGLSLTVPWMVYTTLVMTENAFYPVFMCWFLALVLMLERPTLARQAATLVLLVVAYETRTQAVALVPALVTALVLVSLADGWLGDARPRWRAALVRTATFWPTWLVLAAGTGLYAIVQVGIRGQTLRGSLLRAYAALGNVDYSAGAVLKWTLWQVAELDVVLGVFPFAALLAVLLGSWRRQSTFPALRAFAAAALATSFWLLLEVGAFASSPYSHRMQERNYFYLAPLFLIALAVWAWRSVGREWPVAGTAALAAGALPAVVPFSDFLNGNTVNDSFGLLNIWVLRDKISVAPDHLEVAIVLAAILAAGLFLLVPRRYAVAAPVMVFAFLAYGNRSAEFFTDTASRDARKGGVQERLNWIDRAVGPNADVAAVFTGNRSFVSIWENEFFNRSVRHLYTYLGNLDGLPQQRVITDLKTGVLLAGGEPIRSQYVLTDTALLVAGREVASDDGVGMAVYRTKGPVRLSGSISGIYTDRWTGPTATYSRYACRGGSVTVVFSPPLELQRRPVTVVASIEGRTVGRLVVPPVRGRYPLTVTLVPSGGICTVGFSISPTAVPAQVLGAGNDNRELGVHVRNVVYRPR